MLIELDLSKQREDTNGYMYVYDAKHPMANKAGKVYVHRYVGYLKEGRILGTKEHCHHKDENRKNNSWDNVEVISATEHGRYHIAERFDTVYLTVSCANCGKSLILKESAIKRRKNNFCSAPCATDFSKKVLLTEDQVRVLIWEMPTTKIAERIGVSDKAVEKFCKKHGIEKPPRGYWAKKYNNKI